MKIVLVGHVDHGKSTLIGRWIHDAGRLPDGRLAQLRAAAERRGGTFEFANLTDGLQAERDQNVTIDTTQVRLDWRGRSLVFIDAPGHREFIRNMVTGAAQADAAVLVVDATEGASAQTRRHALLLTLLGIRQVLVVVNKLDAIAPDDRARVFGEAHATVTAILAAAGVSPTATLPCSARHGWNVVDRASELSWFEGPTVADAVLSLPERVEDDRSEPAVFSVQDVYRRGAERVIVGRSECGDIGTGVAVTVLPSGTPATADRWSESDPALAVAGPCTALTVREPLFVSRGDVLAAPGAGLIVAASVTTRVFWLGSQPLAVGSRYDVRLGTQHTEAEVVSIGRVIDASALVERTDTHLVPTHDVADVVLRLARPLVVDPSARARALSRLVVVERAPVTDLAGGGVIVDAVPAARSVATTDGATPVSHAERVHRAGHRGAVVWLTGLSGAGKSTLAEGLERALFDRGMHTVVLDGDRVRFGLNADLGFSADDRRENIRRIAEVAKLFAEAGTIAITAFISPYAADRARARAIAAHADVPFLEVFVNAPLAVCEARDPKGLYRKARAGEIAEFTGVSAPYEAPTSADVVVETGELGVEDSVRRLVEHVMKATRTN